MYYTHEQINQIEDSGTVEASRETKLLAALCHLEIERVRRFEELKNELMGTIQQLKTRLGLD